MEKNEKYCQDSRTVTTHYILPSDTNGHGTLYGGRLMEMIDSVAYLAFAKHTRLVGVTASMDQLNFIAPLPEGDAVTIDTFVSGVSNRSVEVFCKVTGEHPQKGKTYLAATAFLTFVATQKPEHPEGIAAVIPQTDEEKLVCEGYERRRTARLNDREKDKEFNNRLTLN